MNFFEVFEIVSSSKEPTGYNNKPALGIIYVDAQLAYPYNDYVSIMKKAYDLNRNADAGNNSNGMLLFEFRYRLPAETRVKDIGYAYHKIFHPKFPIRDAYNYFHSEKIDNFITSLRDTARYFIQCYETDKLSRCQIQGIYKGNDSRMEKVGTWNRPESNVNDDDDDNDGGRDYPILPSPNYPSMKLDPMALAV